MDIQKSSTKWQKLNQFQQGAFATVKSKYAIKIYILNYLLNPTPSRQNYK